MTYPRPALLAFVVVLVVGACASSAGASPSPDPSTSFEPGASGSPTPAPTATVVDVPEVALARVVETEPRFAGIGPYRDDLIGQSSWYRISPSIVDGVAYEVTIRIGWGDCPAGCIEQHIWQYQVSRDGSVTLASETGGQVPDAVWPAPGGVDKRTGITGTATAGPVCPVETNPPDPACQPRPVAGATIVIRDATGAEIARLATDAGGGFYADLPPGRYVVEAQPVEGLMGTPAAEAVTVGAGAATAIQLGYDTGIR